MKCFRNIVLWLLSVVCMQYASGQPLRTIVDKNKILIGEQIHYEMRLQLGVAGYNVDFGVPDSIPHFEILDRQQYDTIEKNGGYVLIQKLVLTSFDSGQWLLPAFRVVVSAANKKSEIFTNDSMRVMVGYSPSDTTGLHDIKPVMEVKIPDYTIWFIIAAILALLLLAWLIYRWYKKRKKKVKPAFVPSLKPYDEAMSELAKLRAINLSEAEGVKKYYTGLADIFRVYYSNKERRPMMVFTTSDLLVQMKSKNTTAALVSPAAEVLRIADAVKFARYSPPENENDAAWKQTKNIIDSMEKNYSNK